MGQLDATQMTSKLYNVCDTGSATAVTSYSVLVGM